MKPVQLLPHRGRELRCLRGGSDDSLGHARSGCFCCCENVINGRALILSLERWSNGERVGMLTLPGVHTFGLKAGEIRSFVQKVAAAEARCRVDPARFQCWLAGDFSFPVPGELPSLVHDTMGIQGAPADAPATAAEVGAP